MNLPDDERRPSAGERSEPWFRFSLWSLLVSTTVAALLFCVLPWFFALPGDVALAILCGVQLVVELMLWPLIWRNTSRKRRYPPGDDGDPGRPSAALSEKLTQSLRWPS